MMGFRLHSSMIITWACGAFNRSLCFCKDAAENERDGNTV